MVTTLRAIAGDFNEEEDAAPELSDPFVRFRTVNGVDFDCCLDWRADILMWTSEGEEVIVGFIDFLLLQSESRNGDEMFFVLDSISATAAAFTPFFHGGWLDPDVEEALGDGTIDVVLLVTYIFVESPLRGARLGVWAISEMAHRMLPSYTGLLLMPSSTSVLTGNRGSDFKIKRDARLAEYWCSAGLTPVDGHSGFLAAASAFTQLSDARRSLAESGDRRRTVTLTLTLPELHSGDIEAQSLDIEYSPTVTLSGPSAR